MVGFITLQRQMTEWEWYSDSNTKSVFLHFILTANYKDTEFKGIKIKRGSLVCGRNRLSDELGLSPQQIRTAIKKLKSTNEITTTSTNRFTVVTVVKYDFYQHIEASSTSKTANNPTNNQPTDSQQITTSKQGNKGTREQVIDKSITKNKRGTRLPNDWVLPKEWEDWAISEGANVKLECEKFYDYWIAKPGQGGVKLDWAATWRNWIRNSAKKPNGSSNGWIEVAKNERRF